MKIVKLKLSILLLSILGVLIAIYHAAQENYYVSFNSCNINSKFNCGGLFNSGYTGIDGVPFWLLGLAWFIMLVPLGLVIWNRPEIFLPVLMIGNMFTLYLWNIEINIVGIICPVCVTLYCINYAITILSAVKIRM